MARSARRNALVLLTVLMAGVGPGPWRPKAAAQIPETFTHLEVLPKDIPRSELVSVMRGYASALGVRCAHCHVGAEAPDLEGADFASDAKEEKRTARAMMKMVVAINEQHLAPLQPSTP